MKVTLELSNEELVLLITNKVMKKAGARLPSFGKNNLIVDGEINTEWLNSIDTGKLVFILNKLDLKPHLVFTFDSDSMTMIPGSLHLEAMKFGGSSTYECQDENPPLEGCWKKLTPNDVDHIFFYFNSDVEREMPRYSYHELMVSRKMLTYIQTENPREIWLFHDIACLSGWAGYLIVTSEGDHKSFINVRS